MLSALNWAKSGAVAALEQEGAALGGEGELGLELARLAGEDERRIGGEPGFGRSERPGVGVVRAPRTRGRDLQAALLQSAHMGGRFLQARRA